MATEAIDISLIKTGQVVSVHLPFKWYKPWRYLGVGIRAFTSSYWSHTSIFIWVHGHLCVAEADPRVKITPFFDWSRDKIIKVSEYVMPQTIVEKRMGHIIMSKQGYTKYDFLSLLFFQPIYQITGIWIGRKHNKNHDARLYCSEYVAWIYNQYNGMFCDFFKISPGIIANDNRFRTLYVGLAKKLIK